MPELPEVEIVGRNVRRWCGGKRLSSLDEFDDKLRVDGPPLTPLVDRRLTHVVRRAKHLVLDFDGEALLCHFRMTGKLVRVEDTSPRFLRLLLGFEDGTKLGFKDARRLGTVRRLPVDAVDAFFADRRLGPDPWPEQRDGSWWQARYSGCRSPLKPALMVQQRVGGIGNIIASEVCWMARLDPMKSVADLDADAWNRIASATRGVIERTLSAEDGPEVHYLGEAGASTESAFSVYGREGLPCGRCRAPIARFRQGGRSTFWCRDCQPG